MRFCGITFYSKRNVNGFRTTRLFWIPIHTKNLKKELLDRILQNIDDKYDDVYIIRHNIGETYVYLTHLQNWIKKNGSKKPLLLVWQKKDIPLYKMFVNKNITLQYLDISQHDLHSRFTEECIEYKGKRIFCPTPDIFENILEKRKDVPSWTFYTHICKDFAMDTPDKLVKPVVPQDVRHSVELKIKEYLFNEVILTAVLANIPSLYNEFVHTANGGTYVYDASSAFVVYQVLSRTTPVEKRQFAIYTTEIAPSDNTVKTIKNNANALAAAASNADELIDEANAKGIQILKGTNVRAMDATISQLPNCREIVSWAFTKDVKKDGKIVKDTIVCPNANPWMDANERALYNSLKPGTLTFYRGVAMSWCSYSTIIQCREWLPDQIGGLCWFSFENPGQSPRIPIYAGSTSLPAGFDICGHFRYNENAALWHYRKANKLGQVKWGLTKQMFYKERITMTREEIKETVNKFLVEDLEVEPEKLFEEAALKDDVGIDSLDFVDIVVIVEETFGFKIKAEEMSEVRTLSQFYDYIEGKVNAQ